MRMSGAKWTWWQERLGNASRMGIEGIAVIACMLGGSLMAEQPPVKLTYSETKKIDHVDELHGVKVSDPYRWLEDDVRQSKDVAAWVEAKNKETSGYLSTIPERESIKKRLTELWDFERFNVPFKQGGRYYYFYNSGLLNQDVLYTQDTLDSAARVLLEIGRAHV